jgi:hypothetical protein
VPAAGASVSVIFLPVGTVMPPLAVSSPDRVVAAADSVPDSARDAPVAAPVKVGAESVGEVSVLPVRVWTSSTPTSGEVTPCTPDVASRWVAASA